jgi:scyllo-inositol 2-dehydrogenase (NADP+)
LGTEEERQAVGVEIDKSDYFYETAEFIDLVEKGKLESENNSWENSYNTLRVTDEIRRQLGVVFPTDSAK